MGNPNTLIMNDDVLDDNIDESVDTTKHYEIHRQMHRMSIGIDALEGLSLMASHAIDEEIGVTGEQVSALMKCVEFSLLTTQRNIIAALNESDENRH